MISLVTFQLVLVCYKNSPHVLVQWCYHGFQKSLKSLKKFEEFEGGKNKALKVIHYTQKYIIQHNLTSVIRLCYAPCDCYMHAGLGGLLLKCDLIQLLIIC